MLLGRGHSLVIKLGRVLAGSMHTVVVLNEVLKPAIDEFKVSTFIAIVIVSNNLHFSCHGLICNRPTYKIWYEVYR